MQHNFTNVDVQRVGVRKVESDGVSERGAELFCSKSICRVVFGEGGREEEEETLAARACARSDGDEKEEDLEDDVGVRPH